MRPETIAWIIWGALFVIYWTPLIIALSRRMRNWRQVLVVNFFLGWTFIGWVVALAMAVKNREPSQPIASSWTAGAPTFPTYRP